MPSRLKIFFDGGCRPNPGAMELAVVVGGRAIVLRDLGNGTSADAEWLALIQALKTARSMGTRDFVLMGDAAGVIAQANGIAKCRGASVRYLAEFRALVSGSPPRIRYVKRSQNLAGIALARLHAR